jgi:hypothetical protein
VRILCRLPYTFFCGVAGRVIPYELALLSNAFFPFWRLSVWNLSATEMHSFPFWHLSACNLLGLLILTLQCGCGVRAFTRGRYLTRRLIQPGYAVQVNLPRLCVYVCRYGWSRDLFIIAFSESQVALFHSGVALFIEYVLVFRASTDSEALAG